MFQTTIKSEKCLDHVLRIGLPHMSINTIQMQFFCILEHVLTDANSDEERDICEHLPQQVPEVSFTTAVTVFHQLCAPQNCRRDNKLRGHQHIQ